MSRLVLRWKMQCHNTESPIDAHHIEIPTPRHLGLRADQWELERDRLETIFACPQCGLVSLYKGSETQSWVTPLATGQDIPPVHPFCIQLPCVGEGCKSRLEVRTVRYADESRDDVLERLSRANFEGVKCAGGHPVSFQDDAIGAFDDDSARPF